MLNESNELFGYNLIVGPDGCGKTELIRHITESNPGFYDTRKYVLLDKPNPFYTEFSWRIANYSANHQGDINKDKVFQDILTALTIEGAIFEIEAYNKRKSEGEPVETKPTVQDSAHIEKLLARLFQRHDYENVKKVVDVINNYPIPNNAIYVTTTVDERIKRLEKREKLSATDKLKLEGLKESPEEVIYAEQRHLGILKNAFGRNLIKVDTSNRTPEQTCEYVRQKTGL
jgi:thymidylate kinase